MSNFYQDRYKTKLNTLVRWFKRDGQDEYSKPAFTPATGTDIMARKVGKARIIKDRDGKERVSSTVVMTIEDIGVGDYIADAGETDYTQGKVVLSISEAQDPNDNSLIGKSVMI